MTESSFEDEFLSAEPEGLDETERAEVAAESIPAEDPGPDGDLSLTADGIDPTEEA